VIADRRTNHRLLQRYHSAFRDNGRASSREIFMRYGLLTALAIILGLVAATTLQAQQESKPAVDPALEQAIHDYILSHPEVIAEALQKYQQQQEASQQQAQAQALKDLKQTLANHPASPVLGNPNGDVTVVEFLDYRCPYCKAMHQPIADMIAGDGNVRVVIKEFPILGDDSLYAARAALAAAKQGKYAEMHSALMTFKGKPGPKEVDAVAESLGLDTAKLKEDMVAPAVDEELQQNYNLAEALGINGTPAFVVEETLIPGAIKLEDLKAVIAKARENAS
jgi:protein-disulfide isomerase